MMEASPLEAYGKAPLAEGMPYRYIHGRDPSSASEELCLAMSRYTAGAAAWEDATGGGSVLGAIIFPCMARGEHASHASLAKRITTSIRLNFFSTKMANKMKAPPPRVFLCAAPLGRVR